MVWILTSLKAWLNVFAGAHKLERMIVANDDRCWADVLGGCGGPITGEHLVTEALLEKRIRVVGLVAASGAETSRRGFTANILCRDHNSELGRTADAAALRLFRHFKATHNPLQLRGSRILRPPVERNVSGDNFGRWLCKTHCNFMVSTGLKPDPAYIRYSFGQPPEKPIYIYLAASMGDVLRLGDGRDPVVSWKQYLAPNQPEFDAFSVTLSGFESVVTTVPIQRNGEPMVDRLHTLELPTPLGAFSIVFKWTGESAS